MAAAQSGSFHRSNSKGTRPVIFNPSMLNPVYHFFTEMRYLVIRPRLAYSKTHKRPWAYQQYGLVALRFGAIHLMTLGLR
ncbi:hypothetical protein AGR5A_Lc20172 [Agrobacterium genomosp. 5 str. CFBP 6626]|nr:hypothetical protein AGR5A_Lc20172 [Agrobacterium genomosp. 5 str. CFBP 6626]